MPFFSDVLNFPDTRTLLRFGPTKKDLVWLVTARVWLSVYFFKDAVLIMWAFN